MKKKKTLGNYLKKIKWRLILVLFAVIGAFVWAFYKLYDVQIVKGKEYHRGAIEQTVKTYKLEAERGEIRDRTGKKFAVNEASFTPWIHSNELSEDLNIDEVSDDIVAILGIDRDWLRKKLAERKGNYKLKQWITEDERDRLENLKIKGLIVEESVKRFYPYNNLASYIIGFTNIDHEGSEGMEHFYNRELKGISGRLTVLTDARGNPLSFADEKEYAKEDGLNLVTCLDVELQRILDESAKKALRDTSSKKALIIAMEAKTGRILSMVSTPGYDLNNPREPLDDEQRVRWETLSEEEIMEEWYQNWRNDNVSNLYEPGSIFKIITTSIGLEEGITNEEKRYNCTGVWNEARNVELKCVIYPEKHGNITLDKGFEQSCNIVSIRLGLEIGRENFYKYMRAFGFGDKTGIDLPGESVGLLPKDEYFNQVGLATASYGHGMSITPIQMINAAACVVNGGNLMKPYIVDHMTDKEGNVILKNEPTIIRRVLSEETSKRMNKMMRNVVLNGTGRKLNMPEYDIGGKTGTSIKLIDGEYTHDKTVASMVAMIPSEDPEYIFLGILDEPLTQYRTGGVVVGAMLRDALEKALPYLDVEKIKDIEKKKSMPYLVGMDTLSAGRLLNDLGIDFKTEFENDDETDIVIAQSYPEGTDITTGQVILTLGKKITMPNLIGLDKEEAIKVLEELGLEYEINGEGRVYEQSVAPDSDPKDEKIIIKLEE